MKSLGLFVGLVMALAPAQGATLFFGGPDFTWQAQGALPTPNHIWTAGDYWEQSFTGTGLDEATQLILNLTFDDNTLQETLNMDVLLNGNNVGSFSILTGNTSLLNLLFGFAPISGPDYTLRLQAANTITDGFGSVSLLANSDNSNAELSGVPEPATWSMIGLGLAGLAALRARRQRG